VIPQAPRPSLASRRLSMCSRWPCPPWFSLRVCQLGAQLRYSELAPPARRSYSGHCLVQTGRALPAAPMMVMF